METVHLFGRRLDIWKGETDSAPIKTLYHGLSSPVYFNSFISRFCGATSMTRQLSVAKIFSGDQGLILEIAQNTSPYPQFPFIFNCQLLSSFGAEDERLCIGGAGYIDHTWDGSLDGGCFALSNIHLIKQRLNLQLFVLCLTFFNIILNGGDNLCYKKITWQ